MPYVLPVWKQDGRSMSAYINDLEPTSCPRAAALLFTNGADDQLASLTLSCPLAVVSLNHEENVMVSF